MVEAAAWWGVDKWWYEGVDWHEEVTFIFMFWSTAT